MLNLGALLTIIAILSGFAWVVHRWGLKAFKLIFAGSFSFMFGHLTYLAVNSTIVDSPVPVLPHPIFYAVVGACMVFILIYGVMWGKIVRVI